MSEIIDLVWAKVDDQWVIYQSELDSWVHAQENPAAPPCPVCKKSAGIIDVQKEGTMKSGRCKGCGAKLVILKG